MAKKRKKSASKDNSSLWWIITSIVISALFVVSVFKFGVVGTFISNVLAFVLGDLYWLNLLSIVAMGIYYVYAHKKGEAELKVIIGIILLNIVLNTFVASIRARHIGSIDAFVALVSQEFSKITMGANQVFNAGLIGISIYSVFYILFAEVGSYIIIAVLFIIAMLLIVPMSVYKNIFLEAKENVIEAKKRNKEKRELKAIEEENKTSFQNITLSQEEEAKTPSVGKSAFFIDVDEPKEKSISPHEIIDNTTQNEVEIKESEPRILQAEQGNVKYELPPISLLDNIASKSSNVNRTSANIKGQKVIEILKNFGIEASLVNTHVGPSVTKFEIKPDSSVKVTKIQSISDNIKMELAAKDIRIEAPIPGRNAVGIEIPNVEPTMVRMRELVSKMPNDSKTSKLIFALGKDLLGNNIYCELDKMPHLLIAGATGSGKSVCINTIITSFLMHSYPKDVRLVLIDPKKVEFTPYHDIPHLLWPVITDPVMASNMLKKIVVIMEERYEAFADVGVRNIKAFNELVANHNANLKEEERPMEHMPYIVVIIDELADLMAIAGKEVELSIQRITQLARASGIHLVVATQRPSTDVITGIIKSNIPSRISFAVASSIDSRTILDQTGAERLLGNGDMLYAPQGENSPIRIQGVYVTDEEIKSITNYAKKQQKPIYEDSYFEFLNINNNSANSTLASKEEDSLLNDVIDYVVDVQKASTSLLQRRFGIGYNRAARIIETLEDRGIVGPAQGSKPREVYLKKESEE